MSKSSYRTLIFEGVPMMFDSDAFNRAFRIRCSTRDCKLCKLEEIIGSALCVTASAVHMWRFGKNGPSDLERIEELEDFFELPRGSFLKELSKEGRASAMKYTDRQLEAVRRIYAAIIEFLDEFERTNGFNDLWYTLAEEGDVKCTESKLMEYVEDRHHAVMLTGEKDRFDLGGTALYNDLMELVYDGLADMYDGKLAPGYRHDAFEDMALGNPGGVTLEQELRDAHDKLAAILDRHLSDRA